MTDSRVVPRWIVMTALLHGCGVDEPAVSEVESYATVSTYTTSSCSTSVVLGLSTQIADEIGCADPTGLVPFTAAGNLQITSNAVLPYLSLEGKTALENVAQDRLVQVNSAFRTVAQQYLLYRWYQLGRCGITAAATPGRSNHESGRAVDIANYSSLISAMSAEGWSHDVPGDPVHFDHLDSPDIRGRDVAAFQRLWNTNHPDDVISVDGAYGPMTESRLMQSPAEGFAIGPNCMGMDTRTLDVVAIDGPDRVPPQQRVHYAMTLKNSGTATWAGTTSLELASGTSSPLYDTSWTSPTTIATLGSSVAPGMTVTIELDVMTPATDVDLPVFEPLVLEDGATKFGDITLALTVAPSAPPGGESSEKVEYGEVSGGCNATGSSSGASWLVLAAIGLVRRRRTVSSPCRRRSGARSGT